MSKDSTEKGGVVEIGYWRIRGLLEPLKLLCEYAGQEYVLRQWSFAEVEDYRAFKETQPVYCNLPFLRDGDLFLVQSSAILRHLGRRHGLLGDSPLEQALADVVCEQVMDLRNDFINVCYSKDEATFNALAEKYVSTQLPLSLRKLSCMLGECPFFGGQRPCYADFHAYEMLKQNSLFSPATLLPFPSLGAYLLRFEAIPAVAAYLSSDRHVQHPINNSMAM